MGSSASKVKEPLGSYCWSDLPLDLAGIILLRLHTHADNVRFGSVCRHWRYAARLLHSPPPLPWLNFRDGTFERLADGKRHGLRLEAYEQCRGSFDNWLLLEDVRAGRRSHYLKNPLTGDVVRLPGQCKEPVRRGGDVDARVVPPSSTTFHLRKVVMCANGLIAAKISYHELPDVVVFCWPGMSSWPAGICNGTWYHDIARYEGKMYAVSRRGDLYEHELRRDTSTGEPVVTRVERVILAPVSAEGFPPEAVSTLDGPYAAVVCARTCYLVVSRGKLLMVRWIVPYASASARDWADAMAFKVFEADLEMSRWVQLESLNDRVLFVSHDCCKAISAGDQFRGDQIYFVDYGLEFWCIWPTCSKTSTCGVYDMRSNTISPVSARTTDQTKAAWFFPSINDR
ncbi:putative F-box protein At1g65770 [Lolium perenne]|uniref:putative F-box protein At1g65770 n=1 Tax=Lolium perenne TaxID=4522 RepID=UPI0021F5A0D9|nr:uncharacterized protein LOC127303763 [Lolium perenne]